MKKTIIQDSSATEIVVYVNWEDEELLSEAEYKAKLEEEAYISAADSYQFIRWLNENYTADYIWNMDEEEKETIKEEWLEYSCERINKELGYERRVLGIERS